LIRGKKALESIVVDQLRNAQPCAVLRLHHLRHELPAVLQLGLSLG
jgi:hypothetical protein